MFNQVDTNQNNPPSLNKDCTVKHDDQLLNEGNEISMNKKLYKVQDCHLQRAYQACGTHLWFMLNIVCEAIEKQKGKNSFNNRIRRYMQEQLLIETCCLNTCTISDMTRYCP